MPEAGRDECVGKKIVKTEERKLDQTNFDALTRLVVTFRALITGILFISFFFTILTLWAFKCFVPIIVLSLGLALLLDWNFFLTIDELLQQQRGKMWVVSNHLGFVWCYTLQIIAP